MGCISSKLLTKSTSFREELNHSLHRTGNGYPVLEELFTPRNGGDQFLALIRTANTVAKKLRSGSITSNPDTDIKPSFETTTNPETINAWELMAGLEEEEQGQQHKQSPPTVDSSIDLAKRSKSFHLSSGYELSIEWNSNGIKQHGSNENSSGIVRSRSFHTVQEYDEMVERNCLSKAADATKFEDSATNMNLLIHDLCGVSPNMSCNIEENSIEDEKKDQSYLGKKGAGKDKCVIEETMTLEDHKPTNLELETIKAVVNSDSLSEGTNGAEDTTSTRNAMKGKGLRRKAMVKDLTSLRLPSTIDFRPIGNLREWLEVGGQGFPPGDYLTPKFGSFTLPNPMDGKKYGEGSIFDPEIVAAFDEAMQQLKAEEEFILKQIAENLEEDGSKEKELEVESSYHRQE